MSIRRYLLIGVVLSFLLGFLTPHTVFGRPAGNAGAATAVLLNAVEKEIKIPDRSGIARKYFPAYTKHVQDCRRITPRDLSIE